MEISVLESTVSDNYFYGLTDGDDVALVDDICTTGATANAAAASSRRSSSVVAPSWVRICSITRSYCAGSVTQVT